MTLAATPEPRVDYVEDGVTVAHDVPFKFIDTNDLTVTRILVDGTEIVLAETTHYTVVGGNYATGTLTKLSGGVDGATLRIDRNTDAKQLIDYVQGDGFDAENHERALDRLTMYVQELRRDTLTRDDVYDIILATLQAGTGISLEADEEGSTITIVNTIDAEYIRDQVGEILIAGAGIEIVVDDGANTITITSTGAGDAAQNCLLLSGSGGVDATLATAEFIRDTIAACLIGSGVTILHDDGANTITITNDISAEVIRDTIGAALVEGTGITITVNDGADTVTIAVDDERIRDVIGATLVAGTGISIDVDDGANTITITSDRLAPDYAGIVPTARNASFDLADAMNGRGQRLTTGTGVVTIRDQADVALSSGFTVVLRNESGASWTVVRDTAVSLKVNGATASADATIANGGVATIIRWGADDFTITGAGVS